MRFISLDATLNQLPNFGGKITIADMVQAAGTVAVGNSVFVLDRTVLAD